MINVMIACSSLIFMDLNEYLSVGAKAGTGFAIRLASTTLWLPC